MNRLSRCMLALPIAVCVSAGLASPPVHAAPGGASPAAEQDAKPTVDTGVGKNGEALPSNPAFTVTGGVPVTMDNVVRAETSKYLAAETIETGPNKFRHERKGIDLDHQTVIRSNFDLIYSYGVFDISKGITISVPKWDLLQLVQGIDENHVTIGVVYPGQTATFKPSQTSYGSHVYLFMRTQLRSNDDKGLAELHQRQDAVIVKAGSDKPYVPEVKYDIASFNKLRDELIKRAITEGDIAKGFIENIKDAQTPQYQMINLAGWGGLPARHAFYFQLVPGDAAAKEGKPSSVTFKKPDLKYDKAGYWSLTVYDEKGWVVTNPFYMNSRTAKPNPDGSITLNFNGPAGSINNIQVPKNWNALFRAYLPVSVDGIIAYRDDFLANHKILSHP